MSNSGWFRVSRKVFAHSVAERPWCRGFLWLYLVGMAAHDECLVALRNRQFLLKRGQLSISTNELADVSGWSRNRVIRFLTYLHKNGMIQMHTEFAGTLIKIVNYDAWQMDMSAQATEQATAQAEPLSQQMLEAVPEQATAQATEQAEKEKSPHTPLKKEGTRKLQKETPIIPQQGKTKTLNPQIAEVLAYLNQTADNKYRNPGEIPARLAEGHTVAECKVIIDKKCAEWRGTTFEKNLNPVTLFRVVHFDTYLNQKGLKPIPRYNAGVMKGEPYVVNHSATDVQQNKRPGPIMDMSKIVKGD
jgi:uncharacterized phage protein (TIGR02220 family)